LTRYGLGSHSLALLDLWRQLLIGVYTNICWYRVVGRVAKLVREFKDSLR